MNKKNPIIIIVILIVLIVSFIILFKPSNYDKLSNDVKQILKDIGPDERIDDYIIVYNITGDFDDEKKISDSDLETLSNLANKWDVEKYKNLKTKFSINLAFYYKLIVPTYYENAPYKINNLNADIININQSFKLRGYSFVDPWDIDSPVKKIKFYLNSDLKGIYNGYAYNEVDKSFEYISVSLAKTGREWGEPEYSNHLSKSVSEQQSIIYKIFAEDLNKYTSLSENLSLQWIFTSEELKLMSWFFSQIDEKQIQDYDQPSEEPAKQIIGNWLGYTVGNKIVSIFYSINSLDMSISNKDQYNSEFEIKIKLLEAALIGEEVNSPIYDVINLEDLYATNKLSSSLNKEEALKILESKVELSEGYYFTDGTLREINGNYYFIFQIADENAAGSAHGIDINTGDVYEVDEALTLTPFK